MSQVTITATMTEAEAYAFAQFLKRVGFSDYASNAESQQEAYIMIDAGEAIRSALAKQGFAPR